MNAVATVTMLNWIDTYVFITDLKEYLPECGSYFRPVSQVSMFVLNMLTFSTFYFNFSMFKERFPLTFYNV